MAAEQKKAPSTEIESSQDPMAGASASDGRVEAGNATIADRLAGLDVRAQSALLEETFVTPNSLQAEMPTSAPALERSGVITQYGWRALKSVLGLAIIAVAGMGPVQRLLEFSSVDAARETHRRPQEFSLVSPKRLLQHYRH